ncbi:NAD(P)/FAD-dependent oxidoreductase [Devosia sp.]|uniref:NAD(P)/FAD-dependent oxidoreductase n=1 Tax=Devosia sp. TaxID=1871048 RepID=UPI003F728AC4
MQQHIAVIGGGIGGLSLAWALVRRGARVSLYEQGPIPNPVGSSFDEHRITRHSYGGLSGYGALMPHAFRTYDALWRDLGETHYLPTNLLYVARRASDWYAATSGELDAMGIAHRPVSPAEIAARLPMLRPDGITEAFEAEGAGMLFASRIVTALARWLEEAGVALHPHSRVSDVDAEAGRFTVNGERRSADMVAIAAGAWLPAIYPAARPRLTPSRQVMLYLEPPAELAAAWAAAPVLVDQGVTHGGYILPPRGGTRLKLGDHVFTRRGDGSDDRIATAEDVAAVTTAAGEIFADFERYRLLEAKVCYYTVTDDERFVVEPIGTKGWLLSACSGHGFKLGPLIASGLADAIVGKRDAAEVTAWAAGKG